MFPDTTRAQASCTSPPRLQEGDWEGGRQGAWLGLSDTVRYSVRYLPLGSPTVTLKRSYVHVPGVLATVRGVLPGWWAWEGCTRGGAARWVVGSGRGVLPSHPPTHYIGIARTQPLARSPRYRVLQALRALPGPSAHLHSRTRSIPASGPIKARFQDKYTKVSQ